MATLTLTNAAATAAADAVVDLLDAGGGANADMAFQNASSSTLCVCAMASPAFGSATNGVATAGAVSQGTVTAAGTITKCVFRNTADTTVFTCDVTTSGGGGAIILSGTTVNVDDTIDINTLTYTQPTV